MALNPTPELEYIIRRYRRQLEKMEIHAEQVLLYGSQATGLAREGSDIDLIMISKDWESLNQRECLELLGMAAARILEPVVQHSRFGEDGIRVEIQANAVCVLCSDYLIT